MCQLLGLNFNQSVRPSFSFRGFRHRAERNPHGWGIARYEGKAAQVLKEPVNAENSQLAEFIRDYKKFTSQIIIGHVRYGNVGGVSLQNTHPFVRTFRKREVVFAHNGTMNSGLFSDANLKFYRVGDTDSEHLFCSLLTSISEDRITLSNFAAIEEKLREFNLGGNMNLIFSDSEHLFTYHDQTGYNGLWMTNRKSPFGRIELRDEDWEVNLDIEKDPSQKGYIIATQPLTDETWIKCTPGKLNVFKLGECVY